ncbi:murein biosynthesis integral membrane protein MurJ [Myxococcus llanfairpwllgwyngyllgogerychwyrndrobwllllantysiliogogogochensis]|uniref:Probable lipid II flippase MurJ n=1 Tax=Myxococcus llanfairpwllgwyngyllgogerychwyrndrobwllllantysiliogogogochensis TaxID=2590453 RepID=A0A540WSC2_9BACT|nr:murein biosynthesis integral membrane protein MurJ [Myxococcus llanfairpwllgwyngyllgogerychwyrndrobwllllantysiliogogogochensis]TQF11918.1 murein biosynthesis integral membrane protein MurJ [Myxococcus llanfairpwllgwyngyllgogerychwyrndrobwllllantysiliogogogochensis]
MTASVPEPSPPPPTAPSPRSERSSGRGALLVATGILASKLVGLVRERVFAHYLGNEAAAAIFKAALRIPNFLQNLFGEGVLSGSFIPVYAQLLGRKDTEEADRVAGAVFGLLSLATALLVGAGMLFTPLFVDLIAPGFEGHARELAIRVVRVLFPGTGFLVLSAWCLGILNSHRRFLLSYLAPVVWNGAIILTLLVLGGRYGEERLVELLAYGVVAGSFLQFAVQVPSVLKLLGRFRPSLSTVAAPVRQVLKSFGPVVLGRGVVQFSAWVDTAFATLISERAMSSLVYAQTIYLIPVSLFGMAVSAAELPEMARAADGEREEVVAKLRTRIDAGARRIAFWVVPSAAAFFFLGDMVAAALLQTGRFGAADSRYLWYLLIGASVGLVAATVGRLYASAFYALKDPKTPLRFAIVRVALGSLGAWGLGLHGPEWLGLPPELGALGLTLSSGMVAWLESTLLRRKLSRQLGRVGVPSGLLPRLWGAAVIAGMVALGVKLGLASVLGPMPGVQAEWGGAFLAPPAMHPILGFIAVALPMGVIYFAVAAALGVPEASAVFRKVSGRLRRKR